MTVIQVDNLTKHYNGFTAVDGISFSVRPGEIFGFLGPNGAGKTTTINMLTGLARISRGEVHVLGHSYPQGLKAAQERIGVVPDESNLYDELSGFDNLCFCASLYGIPREERERRATERLHQFGLFEVRNRKFRAYSKGMKRKLTIAAALIHEPTLLFLDEPTSGIDVASARQIRRELQALNQKGTTVFLTTHYIEEAERLCHRIAFITQGKVVRIGEIEELMTEAQEEYAVEFTVDRVPEDLTQLTDGFTNMRGRENGTHTLHITSQQPIELMPLMRRLDEQGIEVFEARRLRPSLEDVFVRITGIDVDEMKAERQGGKQ